MVMETRLLTGLETVSLIALFIFLFTALYFVMLSWPRRKRRWPIWALRRWIKRRRIPAFLAKLFWVTPESPALSKKEKLLAGCGLSIDPTAYEVCRRGLMAAAVAGMAFGLAAVRHPALAFYMHPVYWIGGGAAVLLILSGDSVALELLGKYRSQRIMKEIYMISSQLLYYAGSKMSLHAKLSRSLPYAKTIRNELRLLLNEWYGDAAQAIRRFKERLGTDEAYSFAETINSLRLNESEHYYELLRQRIRDYKEKLELAKESRKESASYVLYVIAGIPILNTFRVFVHPWVMEGQKLFDALK